MITRLRQILSVRRPRKTATRPLPRSGGIEVRIERNRFDAMLSHLENVSHGEEAGFLLCGHSRVGDRSVLLAREWLPIPASAKIRRRGFGLAWTSTFSAEVLTRADELQAAAVLVHSHGPSLIPELSGPDRASAASLFPAFSRILTGRPSGSIVLGAGGASGIFWLDGSPCGSLALLRVVGSPIQLWFPQVVLSPPGPRRRLDRQTRAIGPRSSARLAESSVAVVGVCGGGSHVCQQLAHQGFGRIVPIDDDVVEEVNLGRMVGSAPADVDKTLKTDVMRRLISSIDPDIAVDTVPYRFPDPRTLDALKSVDLVISCVDSFVVRDQLNTFCRRHHIPLIDIGMNIETQGEQLKIANGQMLVVLPDSVCLRCAGLINDALIALEQKNRPPGYDRNPEAPGDPQVVSMNGVLASEACNAALDLVTGYAAGSRGSGWWNYNGRTGELVRCETAPTRPGCPACAEQGQGDSLL